MPERDGVDDIITEPLILKGSKFNEEGLSSVARGEPKHKASTCVALSIVASLVLLGLFNTLIATSLMNTDKIDTFLMIYFNVTWDIVGFTFAAIIRNHISALPKEEQDPVSTPAERARVRWIGLGMMLLFQFGNWLYFTGLAATGVTLAAILYQTSTVFVFLFSMSFLKEAVHPYKILAVLCCTAGVTLVAVDSWSAEDGQNSGDLHVGIFALLLSSMLWGLYEVFLAVLMPRASSELVNVFVGYRGASNFLLLWPVALAICFIDPTSWETVRTLPWDGVLRLCALALVSVLTTCMLTLGISWTSPVYMRLGATMASPAAILWDLSAGHAIGAMCYVGVTLTILGFVFCNLRWNCKNYHFETNAVYTPLWVSRFALDSPDPDKRNGGELENGE